MHLCPHLCNTKSHIPLILLQDVGLLECVVLSDALVSDCLCLSLIHHSVYVCVFVLAIESMLSVKHYVMNSFIPVDGRLYGVLSKHAHLNVTMSH